MTRLLHLSDTHLHAAGATTPHPEIDARARLVEVIDRVRAYGPFDAVVVTGDVCEDASTDGARQVRDLVDGLAPVVLAVPGNHDRSAPVAAVFGAPFAQVGPWQVVGCSTQVEGEVAGVGGGALEALAGMDDRPGVLLMHHPIDSRSTHEWFTLAGRDEVVAAVEAHSGPLVILSGHTHQPYAARLGDAYLLGAPSTYYAIRHRGEEFELVLAEYGAAVVNLDDETFEPTVEHIHLTDEQLGTADRIEPGADTTPEQRRED